MNRIFVFICAIVLMLTGCSKNYDNPEIVNDNQNELNETNVLIGMWAYIPGFGGMRDNVYEFVNSNTAFGYGTVYMATYHSIPQAYTEELPGHSDWLYRMGGKRVFTYTFENNKVIFSDGAMFTYLDGKLYMEGSSRVLSRWE